MAIIFKAKCDVANCSCEVAIDDLRAPPPEGWRKITHLNFSTKKVSDSYVCPMHADSAVLPLTTPTDPYTPPAP
jgi:hypothetical protein